LSADDEKKYIVANPEVIAIDQDPLGIAGDRIYNISGAQACIALNIDFVSPV
jgi:hypothetical protein